MSNQDEDLLLINEQGDHLGGGQGGVPGQRVDRGR